MSLRKKKRINTHQSQNQNQDFQIRLWLLFSIFMFASIILRNPSRGLIESETNKQGIDVVVMLDVSKSMQVADIRQSSQTYSRIQMAKSTIQTLITDNPQNRYGLGIFAGEAQGVSPLTTDHNIFLTFLAGVDDQNLSEQGTDLEAALNIGIQRFTEPERGKLLILMSDGGDDQELGFLSQYDDEIKEQNIVVVTAGLGTVQGGPIPMGQDPFGSVVYRQFQGETVIAGFNQNALKKIAKKLNGDFVHLQNVSDGNKLLNLASKLEKKAIASTGSQKASLIRPLTYLIAVLFFLYILSYNYPISSLHLFKSRFHSA